MGNGRNWNWPISQCNSSFFSSLYSPSLFVKNVHAFKMLLVVLAHKSNLSDNVKVNDFFCWHETKTRTVFLFQPLPSVSIITGNNCIGGVYIIVGFFDLLFSKKIWNLFVYFVADFLFALIFEFFVIDSHPPLFVFALYLAFTVQTKISSTTSRAWQTKTKKRIHEMVYFSGIVDLVFESLFLGYLFWITTELGRIVGWNWDN